jgi:hypothetical protein
MWVKGMIGSVAVETSKPEMPVAEHQRRKPKRRSSADRA